MTRSLCTPRRIVDGGTLGLDLLPMIEEAAAVVMIDAVDLRVAPGTVAQLSDDALHGTLPDRVCLIAIQPETIESGLDLTPAVAAAVPVAVAGICGELLAPAAAGASAARRVPAGPEPVGVAT